MAVFLHWTVQQRSLTSNDKDNLKDSDVELFNVEMYPSFQLLIATSTLAWGVNFPAHLVVVKGTEYFDGKTRRYVDFPITGQYLCN